MARGACSAKSFTKSSMRVGQPIVIDNRGGARLCGTAGGSGIIIADEFYQ
jgi:hypothetical protein